MRMQERMLRHLFSSQQVCLQQSQEVLSCLLFLFVCLFVCLLACFLRFAFLSFFARNCLKLTASVRLDLVLFSGCSKKFGRIFAIEALEGQDAALLCHRSALAVVSFANEADAEPKVRHPDGRSCCSLVATNAASLTHTHVHVHSHTHTHSLTHSLTRTHIHSHSLSHTLHLTHTHTRSHTRSLTSIFLCD